MRKHGSGKLHALDPFLLGSENKHDDINLQDAISDTKNDDQSVQAVLNNDDLKHAMTDSDLKGLSQIAKELDISDAKYFDQPMGNQRSLPQSTSTSSEHFITLQFHFYYVFLCSIFTSAFYHLRQKREVSEKRI